MTTGTCVAFIVIAGRRAAALREAALALQTAYRDLRVVTLARMPEWR